MSEAKTQQWQDLVGRPVSYLALVGMAALSGWAALHLRAAIIEWVFIRTGDPIAVSGADKWSTLVLGIAWLVGVVVLAETRRNAVQQGRVARWILRGGIFVLILFLLAWLLRAVVML